MAIRHPRSWLGRSATAAGSLGRPLTRRGMLCLGGMAVGGVAVGGMAALAATSTTASAGTDSDAMLLIETVNTIRARYGLASLNPDARLMEAAQAHAEDIAHRASQPQLAATGDDMHMGSDGSQPADRVVHAGYGYRVVGENVAAGRREPARTVGDWIESPGHFRNMIDSRVHDAGAGCAYNPDDDRFQYYWVLLVAA